VLKLATKFAPDVPAIETAYRAGFRHAELFLDAGILAGWRTAADNARHYPLNYALHFPNRSDLAPDALRAVVSLYRELGCRCMVMHQPMFDKLHGALLDMEPTLCLAVENHRLDRERFSDWAARNPALTLDVEHLWKFTLGDCPLEEMLDQTRQFLQQHAARLKHVHLPGCWPGLDEHRPMYCARELVFPVLSMLQEFAFDGLIVSEVAECFQTPNDLAMDVLLFESWREANES
jgi:hypothetical protein